MAAAGIVTVITTDQGPPQGPLFVCTLGTLGSHTSEHPGSIQQLGVGQGPRDSAEALCTLLTPSFTGSASQCKFRNCNCTESDNRKVQRATPVPQRNLFLTI